VRATKGAAPVQHWIFTIGTRDQPPPEDWLGEWGHAATELWFPEKKRPVSVERGDRAVVYGSSRGFIAAVEVLSEEPEENEDPEGRERWPWRLRHRLLVAKAADGSVADPEAAGIDPARVWRGPTTRVDEEEYRRAVAALLAAASASAG
jgi:hypothetical protein